MKKLNFKLQLILLPLFAMLAITACNRGTKTNAEENLPAGTHAVSVIDVIQTTNYTYLEVLENDGKYWIAVTSREAKPGDVIYFTDFLEMKDFESKELGRTFPLVYFVQDPSDSPVSKQQPASMGKPVNERVQGIEIEHVEGSLTIAGIFADKANLKGDMVKIRGLVVKVNNNIMGKNWVHLQDGTGDEGNYDLTITTTEALEVGSIATFEGKIEVDKDFGAGYSYDVIMEDAKVSDIKPGTPRS
ncbi:hypothetical protein TBC1_1229 [Lentimicrobium saccharophilum]|uniref:GW domain-containing protein n=1 Tax=Lentimicrobium saccharophilum TaxID=1678841 RepID=A0A0S7C332_9BACT|nr:hypothetical protein [Lentimicrobium saccharophilum]GAP44228.1 hypothetical protein TBC1_1229 [Lentimicrobium saccharophilum]